MAFSPDGKTVVTGSRAEDGARLWDAATGMPIGPPLRHPIGVIAAAISPDGKSLLTGSYDYKARLFPIVPELPDDLKLIATWVGALTGLSLNAPHGSISILDNAAWLDKRERLARLNGVAQFRGGEPPGKPIADAARPKPRPRH